MSNPTEPAVLHLRAKRWVPYDDKIIIRGVDMTGASLKAQIRLYPDAPGDPLVSLTNSTPLAQGLSVSVADDAGVPVSTIRMLINETTIEQLLPFASNGTEPGAEVKLSWDMLITVTGMRKARWFQGNFIIVPGSTQI